MLNSISVSEVIYRKAREKMGDSTSFISYKMYPSSNVPPFFFRYFAAIELGPQVKPLVIYKDLNDIFFLMEIKN